MKKQILSILFTLSCLVTFSQIITYTSVRVDDSERDSYLELEEFWSKVHEQTIKDGLAQAWLVWEFIYENEEDSAGKPDFLIMNFHKDSVQREKGFSLNFQDYARKIYPKLSKRNFEKKWNLPRGKRNNYVLQRLDNTYWQGGSLEKGMQVQLNVFEALNDDYESYEMEYFKEWHEKGIVNGTRRWWEFNKILSSNVNVESSSSANGNPTHVTIDMSGRQLSEEEREENQLNWANRSFVDRMMGQNGSASRKMLERYQMKLLMFK